MKNDIQLGKNRVIIQDYETRDSMLPPVVVMCVKDAMKISVGLSVQ